MFANFNREWRGPGKSKIKNPHHSFLSFCSRTGPRSTGFQEGLSLGLCLALLLLSTERLQKLGYRASSRKLWVAASRTVPGDRWVAASRATLGDRWVPVSRTFSADNWVAACWIAPGDCWVPASRAALGDRRVPVSRAFPGDSWVTACWTALGDWWVPASWTASGDHCVLDSRAGAFSEPGKRAKRGSRTHASHKGGGSIRAAGLGVRNLKTGGQFALLDPLQRGHPLPGELKG